MHTASPLRSKERIFIIDAIRGIALCGILILNIYFFARPEPAIFNLDAYHENSRPNVITWYLTNFIVEGSFRALFSMLFGAGAILLITRLEKKESGLAPADVYFTRLLWLLIFGIINCFVLLWPGDILYTYSLCGLFLFPFRKSKVSLLIGIMVLLIGITMFKNNNRFNELVNKKEKGLAALALEEQKKTLTDEQKKDAEAWKESLEKSKVENIRKRADDEIAAMHKSYTEVWKHLLPFNQKIESTIFYHALFFDGLIFMFWGMALYKLGVLTGDRPAWLYVLFVVFGYGIGVGGGIVIGHYWRLAHYNFYEFIRIVPSTSEFYQVHRVFVSLGHLGVIILIWKSGFFGWLLKPFASLGQMAFTNYLMQSVICTLYFNGYGLGNFGSMERYQLWYFTASVWIFQLIFSEIWLRYFLFGPLEWVWRSLTYWKVQPMVRSEVTDVLTPRPPTTRASSGQALHTGEGA